MWALCLHPATPGSGARRGCVCLGSGFGCTPPLLAGLLSRACAGVRAPLVPRHSWLGCAVWVCVFGLGFRLRAATHGWCVGVCVCWCACSPCNPPLLAGVCGLGVCAWARVLAALTSMSPGPTLGASQPSIRTLSTFGSSPVGFLTENVCDERTRSKLSGYCLCNNCLILSPSALSAARQPSKSPP